MTELHESDVQNFIFDFQLYCGTIHEITDIRGPGEEGFSISGVVHTCMDSFNFSVLGLLCTEEAWNVRLADPVESLRKGHRRDVPMKIPKLHKNSKLAEKYHRANVLYDAYNNRSSMSDELRLPHLEEALGYQHFPNYMGVINAIIADYRSYGEDLEHDRLNLCRNN